jgi:hypothetical protein
MADYYADSSVLVKRHVNEIGSGWFRTLADPATGNVIPTSRVSIIEVYSTFNRRVREASLSPVDYAQLAADFASIYGAEYQIVELTVAVADRATRKSLNARMTVQGNHTASNTHWNRPHQGWSGALGGRTKRATDNNRSNVAMPVASA